MQLAPQVAGQLVDWTKENVTMLLAMTRGPVVLHSEVTELMALH